MSMQWTNRTRWENEPKKNANKATINSIKHRQMNLTLTENAIFTQIMPFKWWTNTKSRQNAYVNITERNFLKLSHPFRNQSRHESEIVEEKRWPKNKSNKTKNAPIYRFSITIKIFLLITIFRLFQRITPTIYSCSPFDKFHCDFAVFFKTGNFRK